MPLQNQVKLQSSTNKKTQEATAINKYVNLFSLYILIIYTHPSKTSSKHISEWYPTRWPVRVSICRHHWRQVAQRQRYKETDPGSRWYPTRTRTNKQEPWTSMLIYCIYICLIIFTYPSQTSPNHISGWHPIRTRKNKHQP